jgi:hypothetical protein
MNQFKQYEKYKKSLNKEGKRILRDEIFFLRTAMTCTLTIEATEYFSDYMDNQGWQEFYFRIMEICDEILLTNNSVFLTYIKLAISGDKKAEYYFHNNYDTCFDWYFMDLARAELHKTLIDYNKK